MDQKICAQHGLLTSDQIYVRKRDQKVALECRQCIRAASLCRIPKPCAIHGSNPPDGWTRTATCKTCYKEYLRQYRRDRPGQCAGYEASRAPETRKAQHRKSHHKRRDKLLPKMRERGLRRKIMVIAHYSGGAMKCVRCPEARLMALAVDHVNGREALGHGNWGGTRLQSWLIKNKYPDGFQVLCHNCNSLKSWPSRSERPDLMKRYEAELRLKEEVFTHYSNGERRCATCGISDVRVLNVDHVNGGGTDHRRSLRIVGGVAFYRWLKKEGFPDGYRILCFSCNMVAYLERDLERETDKA